MDRMTCIQMLVSAGITWSMATWLFHEHLARISEVRRVVKVEHFVALAREDAQLRSE